jgi:hypothetical protein
MLAGVGRASCPKEANRRASVWAPWSLFASAIRFESAYGFRAV